MRIFIFFVVIFGSAAAPAMEYEIPSNAPWWKEALKTYVKDFNGKIGICAINLGTRETIKYNADEFFPMASTRKIVLASYIFDQIDKKNLDLKQEVTIDSKDIVPGSGLIKEEFFNNKLLTKKYSVESLLSLMMSDSDNTAADKLMALGGGHEAIDIWLRRNNVNDIRFETDLRTWLKKQAIKTLRYKEAQQAIAQSKQAPYIFKALSMIASILPEPKTIDFSDEITNIAKPEAFNSFLCKVYQGTAPGLQNKKHYELLLNFMSQCKTGQNRIPKELVNTTVFHKTGSGMVGICNDAGIVKTDHKAVVITVFIKDSVNPLPQLEGAIANIALATYNCL
jgi:beta-lactamase class A